MTRHFVLASTPASQLDHRVDAQPWAPEALQQICDIALRGRRVPSAELMASGKAAAA